MSENKKGREQRRNEERTKNGGRKEVRKNKLGTKATTITKKTKKKQKRC